MKPMFSIGDTVRLVGRGANNNYRGQVVGIDSNHLSVMRTGFGEEKLQAGFTYTMMCLCCDTIKRMHEHALELVEG